MSESLFMSDDGYEAGSSPVPSDTKELFAGSMGVDERDAGGRDKGVVGDEEEPDDLDSVVMQSGEVQRSGLRSSSEDSDSQSHKSDLGKDMERRTARVSFDYLNLAGNYWGNTPPVHDTFGTIAGANARAWAQAKEGLVLSNKIPTPPAPGHARPVDMFRVVSPVREVHTRLHKSIKKKEHDGWYIVVALDKNDLLRSGDGLTTDKVRAEPDREIFRFDLVAGQGEDEMTRVRRALHALCERVPVRLGDYGQWEKKFVAEVSLRRAALAPGTLPLHTVHWLSQDGGLYAGCYVSILDAETLSAGGFERVPKNVCRLYVAVNRCDTVHSVPEIPESFQQVQFPEPYPDDEHGVSRSLQVTACKLVLWLQSMMHGSVLTKDAVRTYTRALLRSAGYLPEPRTAHNFRDNLYKGCDLSTVSRHRDCYTLEVSAEVNVDVRSGSFNAIRVPLSTGALFRTKEVLEQTFLRGGDLRLAWEKACIRADFEHSAFDESPESPWAEHVGMRAAREDQLDGDREKSTEAEDGGAGINLRKANFKSKPRLRRDLHPYVRAYTNFAQALKQDAKDRKRQAEKSGTEAKKSLPVCPKAAWAEFQAKWKIDREGWVDAYTGQRHQWTEHSGESRYPFAFSPDAENALVVEDDETGIHVLSNLVPTSLTWNYLKHKYGASLIVLIARLRRSTTGPERAELMLWIHHLYLIRLQLPHSRADRLDMDPNDPTIASVIEQGKVGAADAQACLAITRPWNVQGCTSLDHSKSRDPDSREHDFPHFDKVERVIAQIETVAGRRFRRINEAVYLFDPASTPSRWSWEHNRRYYAVTLRNMTRECNRHFITTATVTFISELKT
ncbi:hypothetical protein LTR56_014223 [Elasticomyces elasticus]|nr:hypothetical protein LTR56_014223 [Elasticomyces elasticus]KAK3645278.1 hypothetical protein LTR22_014856 [Elasticomyces elasticus]KAK4917388.1 hypothetical protein LTR49_014742 [Elasticomyces elasticus]KAK5755122.1 hypothetical protein LTS12_014805 [Elasticomyces elasticus]